VTRNSPDVVSLEQLATYVEDGARLGMGGFHFSRLPIALVRAVVARGVKDLEYISWGGSLGLELLLQADAVRTLTLCFNSLDVFGLAPRFRKAVEEGRVALEEWTALGMMQGHHAAQYGLPSMPFPLPVGSEIVERSGFATVYDDPVTGKPVGAARALPLDVFLLHAQRADEQGNVEIQGGRGLDLSAVFATRDVLVTVEEIVPASTFQSEGAPRALVLPRSFVRAIAVAPNGAYPTSCLPYYPTDYRELMRVTAVDTLEIRQPSVERSRFLRAAATVDPEVVTGAALGKHRAGEPEADDAPATVDEIMVSWLARQYTNESVCSVGSVSPLATVSYFLAKRTHAPELVLMTANGGLIDVAARPMMMTLAEPLDFQTAAMHCGGDDSYHSYYQRGLVTHEVVSAARGLLTDEERIAAGYQPGRVLLITNLCVFGLDVDSRELEVVSIHPGVTPNDVQAATGFPVRLAANVEMTAIPTVDDLRLIRTDIDPLGMRRLEFVAGKERGPLLAALIESEEAAIVESTGVAAGA
jgi:glutaconate CoA-transferase subunit A